LALPDEDVPAVPSLPPLPPQAAKASTNTAAIRARGERTRDESEEKGKLLVLAADRIVSTPRVCRDGVIDSAPR
jgi:hypothetical protein